MGITRKLLIVFAGFILIFYGTIFVLFVNIQNLMETSEQIVNINNRIAALSEKMTGSLINMELNDKKFRVLKKETYQEYFSAAKNEFHNSLEQIIQLDSVQCPLADSWKSIWHSFQVHTQKAMNRQDTESDIPWADDSKIDQWMEEISDARNRNQVHIDEALLKIDTLGRQNQKISLMGFGVSVAAGLLGAVFISRSMLLPLKKLKDGLRTVSNDNYDHVIRINSGDEFGELARAFNDMTLQLKEDESIRSDFIAALSHEIRTPLSSTQEAVKLITEEILGPINEKQKKFLTIAGSEISRINNLLNHLLNVSVLESKQENADQDVLNPNRLVQDACSRLIFKAKSGHVKMKLHECPHAPDVLGAQKELTRVLINIIGNGIKFSPRDSLLEISVLYRKNEPRVTFQVSDQGTGIPKEEQGLIFKKYYRAKSARKNMDGVGLGLNISKKIIRSNNGTIREENNKTNGCSFFITLPVAPKLAIRKRNSMNDDKA